MKTSKIKLVGMAMALLASGVAEAQVFKITKGTKPAALTEAQWDSLIAELQSTVNEKFPSVETGQYTKGMANATAMASTGSTSVYGSSFKYGLVGGSVALGADLGEGNSISDIMSNFSESAKKFAGVGVQSAVVLGLSPGAFTSAQWGIIDPARLRLYVNFLSMSQDLDDADISFSSFGLTGQYRIVQERSLGLSLVKWNGVDVSSGLRIAKNKFSFTQQLPSFSETQGPVSATVAAAPATIGADVGVYSIPVEASTSLRLLYVLNFFGGIGGDFNFGSSKAIADYNTNIAVSGGGTATGALALGGNTSPTAWNLRAFGGLGLEFGVGTLNVGIGKSLTASAWGVNVGANFFY